MRKPRNEKEALLRAIALDEPVEGIKPNSNEEYWLKKIAKKTSGGGSDFVLENANYITDDEADILLNLDDFLKTIGGGTTCELELNVNEINGKKVKAYTEADYSERTIRLKIVGEGVIDKRTCICIEYYGGVNDDGISFQSDFYQNKTLKRLPPWMMKYDGMSNETNVGTMESIGNLKTYRPFYVWFFDLSPNYNYIAVYDPEY